MALRRGLADRVCMETLTDLLERQSGVVSRRQVLAVTGESDAAIRRRLRRREWATILPGVYVDHTGPPTWLQRAWAAVLYAWPAVLYGDSAIRAGDGPGRRDRPDDAPIHVAVAHVRTVERQDGVVIHRVSAFRTKAQHNLSPPRLRIEYAVLSAAADAKDDLSAVGVLSDAVRSRRTTPRRLLDAAHGERRLRRRSFLIGVLADASEGTCSALELEYLRRVERAHGLPSAGRQVCGTRCAGRSTATWSTSTTA